MIIKCYYYYNYHHWINEFDQSETKETNIERERESLKWSADRKFDISVFLQNPLGFNFFDLRDTIFDCK